MTDTRPVMSDLVERLSSTATGLDYLAVLIEVGSHVEPSAVAQCAENVRDAAARITKLETALAEAEGRVKWVFPKSIADMPVKPGKSAYEYVECLILRKGEMLCRPWNCEHQVFDDEAQDDFFCEWSEVTAYMDLTAIRALADPLLDRQGKEGV